MPFFSCPLVQYQASGRTWLFAVATFWESCCEVGTLQCTSCSQDINTTEEHPSYLLRCCLRGRKPCLRLQDERMQDMMVDLRGRFKAICARLGLPEKLQFDAVGLPEEVAVRPSYDF